MIRQFLKSKIHRATVTEANVNYEGSITIDEKLMKEERVLLIIQINGKVRDKIEVLSGTNQKEIEKIIIKNPKIKNWIVGHEIKKIIFVPDKLINIVI